jgi:type IV pilus assembly protein PilM
MVTGPTLATTDFDPYRVWLNIQEPRRPLDSYHLLGLVPLEGDPQRIRAGFQRQQAAMAMWVERADPQLWESVNQELERAFDLLSDAEQKAVLDAGIRRKSSALNGKPRSAAGHGANGGATLPCRHCGQNNQPSRRFCGGCGKPLWEKCPQCGTECAADERFCGACGTDIAGGLDAQSRQFTEQIEEALALAAAHRYDAAISALRGVAAVPDPRFDRFANRALEEITKVECDRKTHARAAEDGLLQARRFMEAYSYESAQHAIEDVPEPLRTPEHSQLLERAKAARHELLALGGEIRQSVERKQTWDLLPKLERLLALKPNHDQARQLAEVLRDNLVKTAKTRLGQHQYREALDALEQIPSFVRSAEVQTLEEAAAELNCLLQTIRNAALADKQLLALAERLCKLAATNPDAAKLREQLADKVKTKPADARLGAPNWSPVPKRTAVGAPVDWLAFPTRAARANDDVRDTLAAYPGQFFTALGLALQGLGLSPIEADLTPQEKTGMLGMLGGISFGKRAASEAWGLDLSDNALKAIKLSRHGKGGDVRIDACEYLEHARSLSHPDVEIDRGSIAEETLRDFVARAGELKGVKICAGFAGPRVLGRFFELPPMPARKVADSIQYEAQHQLPIALAELCWSHEILDETSGKGADDRPRRVLIQAARETQVRDRVAMFKSAGIAIDSVQNDCLALHNAVVYELLSSPDWLDNSAAIAVVDVGTEATNVVVSSPRRVWFRTFTQGGASFTRELVKQLKLTHDQAEQLQRQPAKARRYSQLEAAVQPLLVQLTGEIERSLATYSRVDPDHPVLHVYGMGGGFQFQGLLRFLRTGR